MKLRSGLLALVALVCFVPLALAFSMVMSVYGNVYNTDGTPLVGVRVQAWMNGTERWTLSNVTSDSYPGYESYFLLDVQGDTSEQGLPVSFTIQGVPAVQTVPFIPLGSVNLNLTPQSYINPESIPAVTSSSTTTTTSTTTTSTTTTSTVTQTTTSTTSVAQSTTVAASSTSVPSTTVPASSTTQPASSTTLMASSTTLPASALQPASSTSSTVLATSSTSVERAQASTTILKVSSAAKPATVNTSSGGASLRSYLPYIIIVCIIFVILVVVVVIIFLLLKQ